MPDRPMTDIVLPAHAGVSPAACAALPGGGCAPRPRGGQSCNGDAGYSTVGCSPPTRGSVVASPSGHVTDFVLPAHAGVSRNAVRHVPHGGGAPRPRGGQSPTHQTFRTRGGCSPPTRGSVGCTHAHHHRHHVLPAHAGVSRRSRSAPAPSFGAPRPRGGQSDAHNAAGKMMECSPPTRGSVGDHLGAGLDPAVLPAHAGVSRLRTTSYPLAKLAT